jgi:hypothetical protein
MSEPKATGKTSLDDFKAVRIIVRTLQLFKADDQERILRWAREKLGLPVTSVLAPSTAPTSSILTLGSAGPSTAPPSPMPMPPPMPTSPSPGARDIRSFLQEKRPASDVQFATAVAYYYAFAAPEAQRKAEISTTDLQEAARQADRERLHEPKDTLHNAYKGGYLDRGSTRGAWRINTVGENLVAMAMPGDAASDASLRNPRRGRGRGRKPKPKRTQEPGKRRARRA